MHANEASADVLINGRRGKWAEYFATLEPFDLSKVLADVRINDAQRPVDTRRNSLPTHPGVMDGCNKLGIS